MERVIEQMIIQNKINDEKVEQEVKNHNGKCCMRCGKSIYTYRKYDLCKWCAHEILKG